MKITIDNKVLEGTPEELARYEELKETLGKINGFSTSSHQLASIGITNAKIANLQIDTAKISGDIAREPIQNI